MKTFATKEKRSAPVVRKAHHYVHHPMDPAQLAQQAEIRHILRSTGAQTKLTVGLPNDKYEQEADRVADQVMAMPDPKLQRQPENEEPEEELQRQPEEEEEEPIQAKLIQRQPDNEEEEETLQTKPLADQITPLVQRQEEPPEEEEELQAKSKTGETFAATPSLESQINNIKGGGRPLSGSERSFFEPRLGADFSKVRVHNDTQAVSVSRSVNARAFTLGHDVVFGFGEYSPDTLVGRKLLAHELTHTMQQKGNAQGKIQRAMKFEFQTRNYVWRIDRRGKKVRPLDRKFGRYGYSEDGSKPTYLAVGEQGYPAVEKGDWVEAKGKGVDKEKQAQFIITYKVTRVGKNESNVKLNGVPVRVEQVGKAKNSRKIKGMRGKYNPRTYEFIYIDADNGNKVLPVHRDPTDNFQYGKVKLMRRARKGRKAKKGRKARKSDLKEGSAIELQSETRGRLEFETPKWFRSWCALRLRVKEAVDMTRAFDGAKEVTDDKIKKTIKRKVPRLYESDKRDQDEKPGTVGRLVEWPTGLRTANLPLGSDRLIVEIADPDWNARIQSSEGIALTQYEKLLKEHGGTMEAKRTIESAKEILEKANISPAKVPKLYSFLQMISRYIERGQITNLKRKPAKYAFLLMSRTSFSSIYSELLTPLEQKLFRKLVTTNKIVPMLSKVNSRLKRFNLTGDNKFFRLGHGGGPGPTIQEWLESIFEGRWKRDKKDKKVKKTSSRDLLSPPEHGSAAMGRFDVETEMDKKDTNLVRFEVRGTIKGRTRPRAEWEKYAHDIFKFAWEDRSRKGSTELEYVESSKCPGTYFDYQEAKAEKNR